MPELSRFYGMTIQMYFKDTQQHHKPHVHVVCEGDKAVVGIDGDLLVGRLSNKHMRVLLAWLTIHEEELYEAWNKAVNQQHFDKIKPLD
ncbi:MAG: DUF4160 domain-containing protein [Oscillospiraceae bacterium]|jgi:hypothetical protein|nr:DUF4160 domain-containing protein [Oscillospiraceae bacterium]